MKVWFGCSTADFEQYQEYYFAIRDFVVAEGHVLTRDWLQRTHDLIKAKRKRVGAEEIYRAVIKAINDADILIVEDTISNFSTGHQITLGLQRRKPVLVLWHGQKNKYFDSTMLHGVSSEYLQISQYDLSNYQSIIRGFIKKYEHAGDRYRFNLVIDEVERKYLEWAKYKHQKSRTQVIKESLRARIDSDEEYQYYLSQ